MKYARNLLHPILFGIYPLIYLFSENFSDINYQEMILPLLILLVIPIIFFLVFKIITKDDAKSSLVTSLILITVIFYGYYYEFIIQYIYISKSDIAFFFITLLAICLLVIYKNKIIPSTSIVILNVIALSFIIVPTSNILMKSYNYYIPARNQTTHSNNQSLQNVNKEKNYRDIYYLIFDQYSRNDMLKKYYNHNNDYFTDYLVNKGFYVADNSYANYPHTVQSITSSLNMKYLNYLSNNDVSKNNDPYIYYNLIENNQVIKFLKTHNYKYTHFGSEAAATHSNDNADVNYTIYSFSNNLGTLLSIIYKQSIISPVIIRLLKKDIIQDKLVKSVRQLKYEANLYKLNKLADIADDPYPKFVFMHLLIPHAPFVFDQDGTYVTLIEEKSKSRQANYINQVKFLNK